MRHWRSRRTSSYIYFGGVSGGGCCPDGVPKWGVSAKVRPEPCLLALRKTLGLYANICLANLASGSLLCYSPLHPEIANGVDMIIVRDLIRGAYFGAQKITCAAVQIALAANPPLEIHSIDNVNVLASSRLWRKVVTETLTKEYPQLKLHHHHLHSAAMVMVSKPSKLNGVILTEKLFGDMLASFSSICFFGWSPRTTFKQL
ncbi:hypothetical protein BDQ17DRAFT_1420539 [Cyathus striatus]|nr:hypothetical protein BDQ17DRAFT_1420539 [Cyathus striatus]